MIKTPFEPLAIQRKKPAFLGFWACNNVPPDWKTKHIQWWQSVSVEI